MKRIGLVLSGGLGKGAYQIGAIRALSAYFRPEDFSCVSAASIGALNGYAYMTHILEQAEHLWRTADFQGGMRSVVSVMRSAFLKDIIADHISDGELPCPFYVPLYDLKHHTFDYFDFSRLPKEQLEHYFHAAISLPVATRGVTIGSETYYDGGVVDNIPVAPLLKEQLDYIICIYFDEYYAFEDSEADGKIIKVTFPDDTVISNSVDIRHSSILYMIDEGYRRTKEILDGVFAGGTDRVESVCEAIRKNNEQNPRRRKRITMDVVITNLNRMMRKRERAMKRAEREK